MRYGDGDGRRALACNPSTCIRAHISHATAAAAEENEERRLNNAVR
jgi:hypothetical protein